MLTSALLTTSSLFSVHVFAQVTWPYCTLSSWGWTYNSLNQNPCLVAAFLQSTCNGGSYDLPALNLGYSYAGPEAGYGDLCWCSTVVYSLLSACDACQNEPWFSWYDYSTNCTRGQPPASSFPHPVPSGIRVPQWALIDVTVQGDWNSSQSSTVGDLPEVLGGDTINSGKSTSTPTPTPSVVPSSQTTVSSTSSSSSSTAGPSSNVGAIAGGVAGGLVAVSAAALILFFVLRRRTTQQGPPPAAALYGGTPQPLMGQVQPPSPNDRAFMPSSLPTTSTTAIKLYDPNDPTTFPGHQGTAPGAPEVYTEIPNTYTGSTLASTQNSRPLGYHGLPTV
ncbi:hypothetical protein BGW80DRAFT_1459453 [Lactifluus volemus]|nr:hypothetical protein BGW80DRAFT_1459453 [Lactifluus volemus]